MGAWAIASATHDATVAKGVLGGLHQTSDRAELVAIKEAIKYAAIYKHEVTLWADSAFAATGVNRLLADPHDLPHEKLTEDWEVQQALFGFEDKIRIQHIQSHRDAANGTLDFDDWTAHWNGGASHEALAAHLSGSHEVEDLRKQMVQHHCTQISYLKELTELHFEVAQTSFDQSYEAQEEPEDEEEGDKPQVLDPQRICLQQDLWQLELPPELPQIGEVVLCLKSSVRFLLAVCSVGFGV